MAATTTLGGCYSTGVYTVSQSALESARHIDPAERRSAAVAARRASSREPVWLTAGSLRNGDVREQTGDMATIEARGRDSYSPTGLALLGLALPHLIGGGAVIATRGGDNAGWSLGGGAIVIGVGAAHLLIGGILIGVGRTRTWHEVRPGRPGWTYIPERPVTPPH